MRIPILLIGLITLSLGVRAQNFSDDASEDQMAGHNRWKKGYIVPQHGDTLAGKIKVPDFLDVNYDFQRQVSFKDHRGQANSYLPVDLKAFAYYDDSDSPVQLLTYQSVSSPDGDGLMFMKVYCTGICKVYGCMVTERKNSGNEPGGGAGEMVRSSLIPVEKKYIQIKGSQFSRLKGFRFKKDMIDLFSECPLIQARIESKHYTYDNWREMVQDVNCGICK